LEAHRKRFEVVGGKSGSYYYYGAGESSGYVQFCNFLSTLYKGRAVIVSDASEPVGKDGLEVLSVELHHIGEILNDNGLSQYSLSPHVNTSNCFYYYKSMECRIAIVVYQLLNVDIF
jgi:hypothetical protein